MKRNSVMVIIVLVFAVIITVGFGYAVFVERQSQPDEVIDGEPAQPQEDGISDPEGENPNPQPVPSPTPIPAPSPTSTLTPVSPPEPILTPPPPPVPAPTPTPTPVPPPQPPPPSPPPAPSGSTIIYSDTGYSPGTLTVSVGTVVVFKNQSGVGMWPATDNHPDHTLYPNSGIEKCGTPQDDLIFDACTSVSPGGEYSFRFMEAGEWDYHDHLRPGRTGVIVVR